MVSFPRHANRLFKLSQTIRSHNGHDPGGFQTPIDKHSINQEKYASRIAFICFPVKIVNINTNILVGFLWGKAGILSLTCDLLFGTEKANDDSAY